MGEGQTGRLPANLFQLCDLPLLCLYSRSHAVSSKLIGRALQRTVSDLLLGKVQVIPAASDTMCFFLPCNLRKLEMPSLSCGVCALEKVSKSADGVG